MKKRPGFKAMVITADPEEEEAAFKSSLSVTAGGSLQVRDFHINKLGMSSGITLDELEMDKELGKGASSVVYKATHTPTGQQVAVKMLTNVWDKELRKQLVAEMQFLKPKLKDSPCPFLIQIYDAYFSDDKTYIVLEFCKYGALDDCLQKYGPMPESALSVSIRQIFLGLCYLYSNAIVHRDMKPANCLVDENGIVKISDFGSRMVEAHPQTATQPRLRAPRVTCRRNASTATPTLGMIMLELGMGDHPYKVAFGEDGSFFAMIEYATKRETPPLPPEYSEHARDFANLCLLKDPSQRPRPTVMVNEADPDSSHPFITDFAACGPEEVLGWLKAR